MTGLWEWLSGKKTIIAATLAFVQSFINEFLVGIWHVAWPWIPQLNDSLGWIIMVLGGVGLIHKAVKAANGTT